MSRDYHKITIGETQHYVTITKPVSKLIQTTYISCTNLYSNQIAKEVTRLHAGVYNVTLYLTKAADDFFFRTIFSFYFNINF